MLLRARLDTDDTAIRDLQPYQCRVADSMTRDAASYFGVCYFCIEKGGRLFSFSRPSA
jgi:hypothetical protein